jgi:hypothetical protein
MVEEGEWERWKVVVKAMGGENERRRGREEVKGFGVQ